MNFIAHDSNYQCVIAGHFCFNTPFTKDGHSHGELNEQHIRKTILTTKNSLPYVKQRLEVVHTQKIELHPIEVAISNMEKHISGIKEVSNRHPCDTKLLKKLLLDGLSTTTDIVSCPHKINLNMIVVFYFAYNYYNLLKLWLSIYYKIDPVYFSCSINSL